MADIKITFTIKDSIKNELIEMVSARHGIPDGEDFTPAQWAKEYYRRLMKRELLAYRRDNFTPTEVGEDDIS